jgi:membrane protease YdiL (CAAX protease family)
MNTDFGRKLGSDISVISWLLALIYSLAIMIVEINMLLDHNPGWGALVYGLILISLMIVAALAPDDRIMLIGFTGVPIIQIVAYGIPFSNIELTVYFGTTGLILLFYIIPALRTPDFAGSRFLTTPPNWLIQVAIIGCGAVVGLCQFLVYPPETLYFNGSLDLVTFIATLLLLAFAEEVIFRYIALTGFSRKLSLGIGNIFVAFVYTCLFIPFGSIGLNVVMFFVSLFYGFAAVRSSSLYGVIGAHFVSSFLYYLILPNL